MTLFGETIAAKIAINERLSDREDFGVHVNTRGYGSMQASVGVLPDIGNALTDEVEFPIWQSPPPVIMAANGYDGVAGEPVKVFGGAGIPVAQVGVPFTVPVNCTVYKASFWISRVGLPIGLGGLNPSARFRVKIQADSGGNPGSDVGDGNGYFKEPIDIATDLNKMEFLFDLADVNLTASIPYWLVFDCELITGDDANYVRCHSKDVVGTSGCKTKGSGAWAAVANQDVYFELQCLTYSVISGIAPILFVTNEFTPNDFIVKSQELNLDLYDPFLRVGILVDSGSFWTTSYMAVLGDPTTNPPEDG
jgi:hypothetical protein